MTDALDDPLARTPLTELHIESGGRMVGFAGYEMPLQFRSGVLSEHLWTRQSAGMFDVSHMGQVALLPRSGRLVDAAFALERLVPTDVVGLKPGRQRYGVLTNRDGGIIDDLMIANRGDHLLLVVNASTKSQVVLHLREHLADLCHVEELTHRALLALQGPRAEAALSSLAPNVAGLAFMDVSDVIILGVHCMVTRSGYTGEDGYEISVPAKHSVTVAKALLANPLVGPVGLGARDSLRLEAGLCLYGNDIDHTTTPVEAALEWSIQKVRRRGGAREGGFPGAGIILDQLDHGPARRRVGLRAEGRAPVRVGVTLFADETSDGPIGTVTSGGFGPTVSAPVAMGYVTTSLSVVGSRVFADLRGRRVPMQVTPMPFVAHRYKR